MRELKFRSVFFKFDNSFSHFSYWGFIDHKGNYDHSHKEFTGLSSSGNAVRKHENQYTGLKDKNGKEIYEGDLIKKASDEKIRLMDNVKVRSPYWEISKVIFKDGCFQYIIIAQENSYFGLLPSDPRVLFTPHYWYEVIGNVYENLELLK